MGHFAQGDFFMIGAQMGWWFLVKANVPLLVAIVCSVIGTSVLMLVVERITYRPLYSKVGIGLMMSTMGMQYVVQGIAKIIFGYQGVKMPPMFGDDNLTYPLFGGRVSLAHTDMMLMIICGSLMLILAVFMKYTKIGIAMSAVSMNRKAAQLMGVKLNTIISTTYIMAAALAALAGVLIAPRLSVSYSMGISSGGKAMTAAVLGGFGNMPGAMLGGVLMGIIENIGAFYVSTMYRDAFVFVVLIIILFWRPQGILGRRIITKV
jgi:branched-chain amino acid transport system permease protein